MSISGTCQQSRPPRSGVRVQPVDLTRLAQPTPQEVTMPRRHPMLYRALLLAAPSFLIAACSAADAPSEATRDLTDELTQIAQHPHRSLCPQKVAPGYARCFARVRTADNGQMLALAAPQGIPPPTCAPHTTCPPAAEAVGQLPSWTLRMIRKRKRT